MRQFQFTAWPDHGVPDYPTPLLIFMRRVKAATPSESGPTIVHCSAGVGRTGAFIVIDAMLERIKHEKTVDIYGHVTCLRAKRNYMVQTEDQYIFIHDALLEAVSSGNTEINVKNLCSHINKLTSGTESPTGMELEFKVYYFISCYYYHCSYICIKFFLSNCIDSLFLEPFNNQNRSFPIRQCQSSCQQVQESSS